MKARKWIAVLIALLVIAVLATACGSGISGYEVVKEEFTVDAGGFIRETVECPEGKFVMGGGVQVVGEGTSNFGTIVRESAPGTVGGGQTSLWMVALQNTDKASHTVGIFAVCVNVP
jgi:hypothetical protein